MPDETEITPSIATRMAAIEAQITSAAAGLSVRPRLIAVSKTKPVSLIREALATGHREFGENKVQEALSKWPSLRDEVDDITLHMIGSLQSNKAIEAVRHFDAIHSVDRKSLAVALARAIDKTGRHPKLFMQVNLASEASKGGVDAVDVEKFYRQCTSELGLTISGLMIIPPVDADPSRSFSSLAELARDLDLRELSMGMSGDFEQAIAHGATHIRVGSAIFGERNTK